MNMTARLAAAVVAAAVASASAAMAADTKIPRPTVSYSATRVLEMEQGSLEQKVYSERDKERIEMELGSGMKFVFITRQDLGVAWTLHSDGSYSEEPLDGDVIAGTENGTVVVTVEEKGIERVDGVYAQRYKVKMRTDEGDDLSSGGHWARPS